MAYYHKNLKYHEDVTPKRNMTEDDRGFLKSLQLEMNTQDTTGTADPRFWVIKGTEKIQDSDDPDTYGLFSHEGILAESTEAVCAYLNEHILPDCDVDRTNCKIEQESILGIGVEFILRYKDASGEEDHEYFTVEELNSFLSDNGYDELEVFGISTKPVIYPNTMFLTEKDAREHLQSNDYHYSEDAHTYCMSAWRSPVVERLWKILREVRW